MKVFVAGATGAIGRRLVPRLLERGHEVVGLTRSEEKADALRRLGAEPVIGDALDAAQILRAVGKADPEAVINELTELPQAVKPRKLKQYYAANDRIRREGTANLLDACRTARVDRMVLQSVAFWYAPRSDGLHREDEPFFVEAPEPIGSAARTIAATEDSLAQAPELEAVILRYGFLYGPGTWYSPDGDVGKQVRGWRYPIIGKGDGVFSFVHVDDAAEATIAALTGSPGTYNVVDDEPAPTAEWLPVFADALGARKPMRVPRALARVAAGKAPVVWLENLRGADNKRTKSRLGWQPRHTTWRTGFFEALED